LELKVLSCTRILLYNIQLWAFEKVVQVRIIAISWKQVNDRIKAACCCAWAAKQAERSGLPPFFGATFCIRAKGGKHIPA
jgi:hypothetical protein